MFARERGPLFGVCLHFTAIQTPQNIEMGKGPRLDYITDSEYTKASLTYQVKKTQTPRRIKNFHSLFGHQQAHRL